METSPPTAGRRPRRRRRAPTGFEQLADAAPGSHQRRARDDRGHALMEPTAAGPGRAARGALRPPPRPRAGAAPPTATSPPRHTSSSSPASPRNRSSATSRGAGAGRRPGAGRRRRRADSAPTPAVSTEVAGLDRRSPMGELPVGVELRHVRAPRAGSDGLRRRRPRRGDRRAGAARAPAPRAVRSRQPGGRGRRPARGDRDAARRGPRQRPAEGRAASRSARRARVRAPARRRRRPQRDG